MEVAAIARGGVAGGRGGAGLDALCAELGATPLTLDRAPLCARTARPMVVASDSRTASLVVRFFSEGGR